MKINPIVLKGQWKEGYALDVHTTSSVYLGENEFGKKIFDTNYSEIGQLLYDLKYKKDKKSAVKIADIAYSFLTEKRIDKKINVIIPIPPSNQNREFQPVFEICKKLSKNLNVFFSDSILTKNSTSQLKGLNINDKHNAISGTIIRKKRFLADVNVLLVDDLFQTGETLNEAAKVLSSDKKIKDVYVLTITKTRR